MIPLDIRPATPSDIDVLVSLYRLLEAEMSALSDMWAIADGLAEPVADAFAEAVGRPDTHVEIGSIDDYPFGFLLATIEETLPQGEGERIGSIRLIFVDPAAREVGLGEALRESALVRLRAEGIRRFDAHVLPGHRLVKNFFEAGGFSARSIIMHHADER